MSVSPSGLPDDVPAAQVLLHRGALVGRPEAERYRAPEPLAADAAILGLEDAAHGLARRARHAVHVGLEPLADLVRIAPPRNEALRLVRRLEPRARERLVRAVAAEGLVVRLGVLGEPVGTRLVPLDRPWRRHVAVVPHAHDALGRARVVARAAEEAGHVRLGPAPLVLPALARVVLRVAVDPDVVAVVDAHGAGILGVDVHVGLAHVRGALVAPVHV